MTMTLVVEDGTLIEGANTYLSLDDVRAYALARGTTLTSNDTKLTTYVVQAMDYLESFADEFKGTKTSSDQSLQWPRTDVVIDGSDYPDDEIPIAVKHALGRLIMDISSGIVLMPTVEGGPFVTEEQIGTIRTAYSQTIGTSGKPKLTAFKTIIKPVIKTNSGLLISTFRA